MAAPAADALVAEVVVAVVLVVAALFGRAVMGVGAASSASGLTTTKEVTGVTKLYLRERLVALSVRSLWVAASVVLNLASSNSLMVK